MDDTTFQLLLFVAGIVVAGYAWFLKRIINNVERDAEKLQVEVDHIKIHYLNKEEFKEFKNELRGLLLEIRQDIKELGRK
jgi:predicted deacetylase